MASLRKCGEAGAADAVGVPDRDVAPEQAPADLDPGQGRVKCLSREERSSTTLAIRGTAAGAVVHDDQRNAMNVRICRSSVLPSRRPLSPLGLARRQQPQ